MIPIRHARIASLVSSVLISTVPSLASAKDTKVDLCHHDDVAHTLLISVSQAAVAQHIANHGDVLLADSIFYSDADGDGAGDPSVSVHACTQPTGFVSNMSDACPLDGSKTTQQTYYRDADGDGFGDPAVSIQACTAAAGYVANAGDCNDGQALAWSGATEVPGDGVDNDCDPNTPDRVDCPCEALFVSAESIWETQRGRGWNPTLSAGESQAICFESFHTNPSFQATDITLVETAFGPNGEGCYATVREDHRESGGSVEFLMDTLIPYSAAPALKAAQKNACASFLATFCVP
jgi:hypothetical protein